MLVTGCLLPPPPYRYLQVWHLLYADPGSDGYGYPNSNATHLKLSGGGGWRNSNSVYDLFSPGNRTTWTPRPVSPWDQIR
jgi:hypothetical protein